MTDSARNTSVTDTWQATKKSRIPRYPTSFFGTRYTAVGGLGQRYAATPTNVCMNPDLSVSW